MSSSYILGLNIPINSVNQSSARKPSSPIHSITSSTWTAPLHLERVLGLSTKRPSGLSLHPSSSEIPLIAYPAGGVVVLYNHKRNRQVGFLIPSSAASLSNHNNNSSANDPLASAGALLQGMNGRKTSLSAAVKGVSCLAFSPDGDYLAVGEVYHSL